MKDQIIYILLNQTSYEKPLTAQELHTMVDPDLSLRTFRRLIPEILDSFNRQQYEKVIKGVLSKDNAKLILSDKSRGFYQAGDRDSRKKGVVAYFQTVKSELEKARFFNDFTKEVDHNYFQIDFPFLNSVNEPGLF